MVELKAVYQCFNGENNVQRIRVVSNTYVSTPLIIEFRLPDGNTYTVDNVVTDDSGCAVCDLSKEVLYQNGKVSAQATVKLPSGEIEKSNIITFAVHPSINAEDDFDILVFNNRLYPKGGNLFRAVGDNDSYKLKFIGAESLGEVFAIFSRDGNMSPPLLLDDNFEVNVPLWVLKKGSFEVGLYAEGYATTPLEIVVDKSIIDEDEVIKEDPPETIVNQLLSKVNSIKYITSCSVVDGKLMIYLNDGSEIDAGVVSTGVDQEQNDDSQPDYIKNRTHYKEIDTEGNVIYHKLDNNYLNLDSEIKQNSDNPVTAKAVYKAVDAAEPEALTNLEIEELLKNFV